jgi:hypothetical protein
MQASSAGSDWTSVQRRPVSWSGPWSRPAGPLAPGALAGSYVGASAGATVGAGLGANILVGGGPQSFALQPLSMEGQAGLSVAAGVADLELRPAQLVR